jgi:hypothetical protein
MGRMIAAAYRWKPRTSRTRRALPLSALILVRVVVSVMMMSSWWIETVWSLHLAAT